MGTRANIKIISKTKEVILYNHYDGYPDGLGKKLNDYLKSQIGIHNWNMYII